jgi:hypothetical protein
MKTVMIAPAVLLSFCVWSWISCQPPVNSSSKLVPVNPLPKELTENSGLLEMDEDLYVGLNDGGDHPNLYLFSLKRRSATRIIKIKNAQNVDWEDLTMDDVYVYIGDTGNNDGTRTDLTIYRVSKDDLRKKDEAEAEKITYSYNTQTKFSSSSKNNFDCEAMICNGDSLYLFSKNRGNKKTDLYSLPKAPGNYKAMHTGQFEAMGLITSAAYRKTADKSELVLLGYDNKGKSYNGFMIYFPAVNGNHFLSGVSKRVDFNTSLQIESVIFHDEKQVYISNEESGGNAGLIYKADLPL